MALPNLIHPVPIRIQRINKSTTIMDEETREPVQQASYETTIELPGQVKWQSDFSSSPDLAGDVMSSSGYVLFRKVDLDAAGVTILPDDRIIKMGIVETDVYVNRLEYTGHYPDQGGNTLLKAYFIDRAPSRQTRGA